MMESECMEGTGETSSPQEPESLCYVWGPLSTLVEHCQSHLGGKNLENPKISVPSAEILRTLIPFVNRTPKVVNLKRKVEETKKTQHKQPRQNTQGMLYKCYMCFRTFTRVEDCQNHQLKHEPLKVVRSNKGLQGSSEPGISQIHGIYTGIPSDTSSTPGHPQVSVVESYDFHLPNTEEVAAEVEVAAIEETDATWEESTGVCDTRNILPEEMVAAGHPQVSAVESYDFHLPNTEEVDAEVEVGTIEEPGATWEESTGVCDTPNVKREETVNSVICAETPENVTNEVENSPTLEEVEESPVELEIDVGGDIQAEEMASSVVFVETLENGIKVKIVEDNGRGVGVNGETETVNGEMGTVNRLMEAINRGMEMVNGLMETINGGMEMVMKENSPMVEREEGSPVEGSVAENAGTSQTLARVGRPNSVKSLQKRPFMQRKSEEKFLVKILGPDQPYLEIKQQSTDSGNKYIRIFSSGSYTKTPWLTGCCQDQALFCFPCLLFQEAGTDPAWTMTGITDMEHLVARIKAHEQHQGHMVNMFKLMLFGQELTAAQQQNSTYVLQHNKEVTMNRYILSKMIDCVKFSELDIELALEGSGEMDSSSNMGPFSGFLDSVAKLDRILYNQMECSVGFQGLSKSSIVNDWLDCMLSVMREHIVAEIRSADFMSFQFDETLSISAGHQQLLVLRYIDQSNKLQERFYEFFPVQNTTTDEIAKTLLGRLNTVLTDEHKGRVIAQACACAMRGAAGGVPEKIKDVYPYAHYVHSYTHQPGLVMKQATSHIPPVCVFFSNLNAIATFFSYSTTLSVLHTVVTQHSPGSAPAQWDFQNNAIYIVSKNKEDLVHCFEIISYSGRKYYSETVREAGTFRRLLEDEEFGFLLDLFLTLMPLVDALSSQLQDTVFPQVILKTFAKTMKSIKKFIPSLYGKHKMSLEQQSTKPQQKLDHVDYPVMAAEVCDAILAHVKKRFSFTGHINTAALLRANMFEQYRMEFPDASLSVVVNAYPMLNKSKLRAELSLVYSKEEFRAFGNQAVAMLRFFTENNLQDTFPETVALLKIHITTPMCTAESERCLPTLNRIKAFLRKSVPGHQLNALAMVSIEKKLIHDIPDFNKKVIEKCAALKERKSMFMYK